VRAWFGVPLLLVPGRALACATCIGPPWSKADLGFFWSALFLMGIPIVVAGIIGGGLYYHSRQARHPGEGLTVRLVGTRKESKE
jgi:hypothetical protein